MTARPNAPRPNASRAAPVPRAPESTGRLDSADTRQLPHVSSARVWTSPQAAPPRPAIRALPVAPAAPPVIREKALTPSHHVRADGTEEIRACDIMIVVPKAASPRPRAESTGEIGVGDILSAEPAGEIPVEIDEPSFRPPAFSVHATQEVLLDDVLEVKAAPASAPPPSSHGFLLQLPDSFASQLAAVPQAPPPVQPAPQPARLGGREEAPSAPPPPWTIDAADEFEFPSSQPVMSGPYPALSGSRFTNFSATEVFRRRSHGVKLVVASVTFALVVMAVAGVARVSPSFSNAEGPVGIALRTPKSLERAARTRDRIVGYAPRLAGAVTVSIDDLAPVRRHRWR